MVFKADDVEVPAFWSQVASDVLAQKYFRKAGVPARLKKVEEETVPSFLWRSVADEDALAALPEKERIVGEHSAKQVFDRLAGTWTYWGWKGGYFDSRRRRAGLLRRAALHAGDADGGAELAAMVQHRPALGLRHRRPEPGPLLRRLPERQAHQVEVVLRASAAARLLHPVDRRRPGQRGRHHGSVGARGAPVQIRLRHRHQLLLAARREREARGRRQVVRPDELPQDRRPRGGRDQVGRHHAPRGQDGDRRYRPSGHRGLHRLEGEGGAEGRGARHRLEDQPEAPEGGAEGLRELRRLGRRLLPAGEEPGAEARDQARAAQPRARQLHQARDPVRQAGLQGHRFPDLRHRLGLGGVSHRLGPELEQLGARHRRIPQSGRSRRRLGPDLAHAQEGRQDAEGARPVGEDRPRRLGLGRSRPAIPHHRERLAHLPGVGTDPRQSNPCSEYMFLDDTACNLASINLLPYRDAEDRRVRRRGLRAHHPAVDHRARNLGDDGAVSDRSRSRSSPTSTARSASATPISAAC